MTVRTLLLCLALCFAHPLSAADWLRAETDNFVIHAKLDEDAMREIAQRFEDFDRMLHSQLPSEDRTVRKLQIYLDARPNRISRAFGIQTSGSGRNLPEMSATFSLYDRSDDPLFRDRSVFYALTNHHIDHSYIRPNPLWVRNGVPAFFSTAYTSEDGAFIVGAPDIRLPLRSAVNEANLSAMLAVQTKPRNSHAWNRFFALSRETVTPLLIDPQYSGVLESYIDAFAAGETMEQAAIKLGDLSELAQHVRDRQNTTTPTFRQIMLPDQPAADIAVRPMEEDEIALIALRFERLVDEKRERTARNIGRLTDDFPQSALVWYEFAAAEFAIARASEFGGDTLFRGFGFSNGELIVTANPYSDAKAWAAVNRALELNPDLKQAQVLRAEILLSRLVRSGDLDDDTAFENVRTALEPLAAQPALNPLAAALSFQSYIEQGIAPSDEALDRLGRAFVANPGVEALRYAYAVALSRQGQRDVAEILLTSMLNDPEYSEAAQRALDLSN